MLRCKLKWKKIKDYEYEVSEFGHVRSLKSGKTLQTHICSGYCKISLCKDGKVRKFFNHRLVAESFIPNPENLPTVNHKNGVRTYNHYSNLEWSSYKNQELHKNRIVNARKRGVHKHTDGFWTAQITINGKKQHLGSFYDKNEAYEAYRQKYLDIYGVEPWANTSK